MWGSKKTTTRVAGRTTLISGDTVVVGDLRFGGTLEVEGLVQGSIVALPGKDALVRIVGKGRVEGEIHAPFVVINGAVHGDVYCTKLLELAPRARVQGNVFYAQVEMAAGSEVNGNLTHAAPAAEPAGAVERAAPDSDGRPVSAKAV